ncbi:DUF1187 family protein [Enterobacteriaceae bacterium RIT711]|nr:DUF1187 family protein [Enterobacteriaceae bacterium RIT711]
MNTFPRVRVIIVFLAGIISGGEVYKISAIIMKPGNPPVLWTKYSAQKMTKKQCEDFFSTRKEAGRTLECLVRLTDFQCRAVHQR